jgi:hypothetical protein
MRLIAHIHASYSFNSGLRRFDPEEMWFFSAFYAAPELTFRRQ